MDLTNHLHSIVRSSTEFGRMPVFSALGLLPLLSVNDLSYQLGISSEALLRWEAVVDWMERVEPLLRDGGYLIVAYWILVLLPLYGVRRMRRTVASSLESTSLLIGLLCWWSSFIVTFRLVGWFATVIGVLLGGVGVIPVALYATAMKRDWTTLLNLAVPLAMTVIPRLVAKSITDRLFILREADRNRADYWVHGR